GEKAEGGSRNPLASKAGGAENAPQDEIRQTVHGPARGHTNSRHEALSGRPTYAREGQARREAEGARATSRQKSGRWKKAGSSERRRARRSGEAARSVT